VLLAWQRLVWRNIPGTGVEFQAAGSQQLGRDTVEAVVWPMSQAAAVVLDRLLRAAGNAKCRP
jgi:hypothetical protein